MNLASVYIISYFGNLEVRKPKHAEQVEWFKEKNFDIHVLNQKYTDEDYISGVKYHGDNTNMSPAAARNRLLKVFYDSDEDFAVFADNDAVVKYLADFDFFAEMRKHDMDGVDLMIPLNPIRLPFNKHYAENKVMYDENFVFERATDLKGSLFILRNLKKFYGREVYFDEDYFTLAGKSIVPGEDTDFLLNMLSEGFMCYMVRNVVLKEFSVKSTWADESSDDRARPDIKLHLVQKYNIPYTNSADKTYSYYGYLDGQPKLFEDFDQIKPYQKRKDNIEWYELPHLMMFDEVEKHFEGTDFKLNPKDYNKIRIAYKDINPSHPRRLELPLEE